MNNEVIATNTERELSPSPNNTEGLVLSFPENLPQLPEYVELGRTEATQHQIESRSITDDENGNISPVKVGLLSLGVAGVFATWAVIDERKKRS